VHVTDEWRSSWCGSLCSNWRHRIGSFECSSSRSSHRPVVSSWIGATVGAAFDAAGHVAVTDEW
jgi:hypothetical protein